MQSRFRARPPSATSFALPWGNEFMRLYGFGARCGPIKNLLQRRGRASGGSAPARVSTRPGREFHA